MRFLITRRERLDFPDGINISIFSLAKALRDAGHEVHFLATYQTDRAKIAEFFEFHDATAIHSLSEKKWGELNNSKLLFLWLKKAKAFVRQLKPDAIIHNGVLPIRLPAPAVAVCHDLQYKGRRIGPHFMRLSNLIRIAYKWWAYRRVDKVAVTCSELLPALSAEIGLDPAKISILPTCFNVAEYRGLPLAERRNAIIHIGTAVYKNPGGSINAFARMKNTATELLIVGQKNPELDQLIAAQPSAVAARIQVTGFLSMAELRRLFGSVRVVAVPSDYILPVASPTAIEPLLAGTPIVCSPSISRDITDSGAALVVNMNNLDQVAAGLDQLTEDDAGWLLMSAAAGKIAERFSAVNVAHSYVEFFSATKSRMG